MLQQMLFQRRRNRALARRRESSEPDGEALLLVVLVAFFAREAFVPGDVTISSSLSAICDSQVGKIRASRGEERERGAGGGGTDVAIVLICRNWVSKKTKKRQVKYESSRCRMR